MTAWRITPPGDLDFQPLDRLAGVLDVQLLGCGFNLQTASAGEGAIGVEE
jgi:hypothetical protein